MNSSEIIGIAMYSDDLHEIEDVISKNAFSNDEDIKAAVVHSVGHLARRFGIKSKTLDELLNGAKNNYLDSAFVYGAFIDMQSDLSYFLKYEAKLPVFRS